MSHPKEWLISKRDGKYLVDPRSHDDREGSTHRVIDWEIYDQVCRELEEACKERDEIRAKYGDLVSVGIEPDDHRRVLEANWKLAEYRKWALDARAFFEFITAKGIVFNEFRQVADLLAQFPENRESDDEQT